MWLFGVGSGGGLGRLMARGVVEAVIGGGGGGLTAPPPPSQPHLLDGR